MAAQMISCTRTSWILVLSIIPFISSITNGGPICQDPNRIDIKGSGDVRKVVLGGKLVLLCCTGRTHDRPSRLIWVLPDSSNAPDFTRATGNDVYTIPGGGFISSNKIYLIFRNITRKQLGIYTCENEMDSSVKTASINVVQRSRLMIDAPSVQWARLGRPGKLVCNARGHNMLNIAWYYRGRLLSTGSPGGTTLQGRMGNRFIRQKGGRVLAILPRVEWGNGGQYMCKAEVETDLAGDLIEVKPITLSVYQSPEIKQISVRKSSKADRNGRRLAVEGQDTSLFCLVKSYPDARVEWYKNNRMIKPDFHFKKSEINTEKYMLISTLSIRKFRQSDIGNYTCNATLHIPSSNITDIASKSYFIDAILKPTFTEFQRMNVTTRENSTVLLKCNAVGAEIPFMQLKFYRHGRLIRTNRRKNMFVSKVSDPGNKKNITLILEFRAIRPSDAGEYTCVAVTDAGRRQLNGRVVVRYPPRMTNSTTQAYGWRGHRTKLRCRAEGSPTPTWSWLMNGLRLANDNDVIRQEGYLNGVASSTTLFVQPNFDNDRVFGRYTCIAHNDLGEQRATTTLLRARRPGLPEITISEAHATSISLQLEPPHQTGGAPLSHYQLRYKVYKGKKLRLQQPVNGHFFGPYDIALDRNLNIRGMMPHATYEFHIAAVNLVGPGLEQILNFTTGAIGNPQPVQIVSLLSTKDPTIHLLKWKPNGNGGFPIRQYRIRMRPVELDPEKPGTIKKVLGGWIEYNVFSGLSLKISNLRPFTYYQVKIQARTAFGASERSALFKTKGVVGKTSALTSFGAHAASLRGTSPLFVSLSLLCLTHSALLHSEFLT